VRACPSAADWSVGTTLVTGTGRAHGNLTLYSREAWCGVCRTPGASEPHGPSAAGDLESLPVGSTVLPGLDRIESALVEQGPNGRERLAHPRSNLSN
jgi:hypothetical protein